MTTTATVVSPGIGQTWSSGAVRTVEATGAGPSSRAWRAALVGALGVVAGWLMLTLLLGRVRPIATRDAIAARLAAAALPSLALVAVVGAVSAWTSAPGPFPLTPGVWQACLAVLLVGWAATGLTLRRPAPLPADSPAEAQEPQRTTAAGSEPAPQAPGLLRTTAARLGWPGWLVLAIAAVATGVQSYGIAHEHLWQDEATSLLAAASIRHHGIPLLPSGLTYYKGELYHLLLAVASALTSNVVALRAITLLWFAATLVVFGLLLMPTLAPGRPVARVTATLVLALAPAEVVWSHDIRMYQQMQFFAVLFLALFLRALTQGRRRQIIGSAAALLAMYLSHEESFVLLPAIPVLLAMQWRTRWWARRAWWLSYGLVGAAIAAQYLLSRLHPASFGQDLSNRPYVGWDPAQSTYYYTAVLFRPLGAGGSLAVVSTLAVIAAIIGAVRRDRLRILAAAALVSALVAMSLLFTVKIDRYSFVLIPLLVALAVLGGADLLDTARRLLLPETPAARSGRAAGWSRPWASVSLVLAGVLGVTAVLATMAGSPRDYSLLAARLTSTTTTYQHADYDRASAYVRAHLQPGDQVMTLAPPVLPAYYLGRTPDRIIQTGRNKLLYLIEAHGQATDTILGAQSLLTGTAVTAYVTSHRRVWLITDQGSYLQSVPPDVWSAVLTHFTLVYMGSGTSVWLSEQ